MKKLLVIGLGLVLLGAISCAPLSAIFDNTPLYAAEAANEVSVSGNIMAVFWKIADGKVVLWCYDAKIMDMGDGTWDIEGKGITANGVNQTTIDYGLYQYQDLPNPLSTTYYIGDLTLQAITADDLPHSQHIGKLVNVNPTLAKPATVTRKWHGITFDIQCLVSQTVVDMWIADTLNIGDYVIVSFIDEVPDSEEVNLAIVVDKVYQSWG